MSDIEKKIQAHIEKFVAELSDLGRQAAIKAVTDALSGNAKPAQTARPRPAKALAAGARRSVGGRRSPGAMKKQQKDLLDYIAANPGQKMETIAAALGSTSTRMGRPVSKLLKAGTVRREGEKRASRYFPGGAAGRPAKKTAPRKTARKTTAPRKRKTASK